LQGLAKDKYKEDWDAHHISAFLRCLFGGASALRVRVR
jgi:hypothetical protein